VNTPQQDSNRHSLEFDVAVCLSGGLDSCVSLRWCQSEGLKCLCLHYDLGLGGSARARNAARDICVLYNTPLEIVSIHASQTLPYRQLPGSSIGTILFLLLASAFAYSTNCRAIALGLTRRELKSLRGDPQWRHATRVLHSPCGEAPSLTTLFPLSQMSKPDVKRLASRLEIPTSLTWSCLSSSAVPCGECSGCKTRNRSRVGG